MKTTTATFDTANALRNREPVFELSFDGLTRKYSTGTFGDISGDHKKYIADIRISPTKIDPIRNNVTIGKTSITVKDDSSLDVADLITQNDLHNIKATIKFGFQSLNIADFISFPDWRIIDIQPNPDKVSYTFVCEDASRLVATTIGKFAVTTNINESGSELSSSNTTVTVNSTTGFIDATNIPAEIERYMSVGIRVDDELMTYASLGGTTFTVSRGAGATQQTVHADDAEVTQILMFTQGSGTSSGAGNLLFKPLLHLLLTTEDGSGHAYYDLSAYDSAFKDVGFGYTAAEVDITGIENLENLLFFNTVIHLDSRESNSSQSMGIVEEINGFKAVEDLFLNPSGAFFFVNSDNQLSVGTFDSVELLTNFSSVVTFDDDDMVGFDYKVDWKNMINIIKVSTFIDATTQSPNTSKSFKLNESVTDYGANSTPLRLNGWLVDGSGTGNQENFIENNYCRRWMYTFGNPPADFAFNSLTKNIVYEPGDHVTFDTTNEVDLTGANSSSGWTGKLGFLTSQDIGLRGNEFSVSYGGLIFNIFDKVSGFLTNEVTITSGSITRTALDFDSDVTFNLNANDAYHDLGGGVDTADGWRIIVTITPPNSATEHNLFAITFIPVDTTALTAAFTADSGTDILSSVAHGLVNNDRVRLHSSTDDLPSGLTTFDLYHVVNKNNDDFQVSTNQGGGAVDFIDNGTGTLTFHAGAPFYALVQPTLRYLSSESAAYDVDFSCITQDGAISFDRMIINAHNLRKTDGTSVGAPETPTLALKEIKYFTLNKTISPL